MFSPGTVQANAVPRLPLLAPPPLFPLIVVQMHCLPLWEWPSHLVNRQLWPVLESTACHVAGAHHPRISAQKGSEALEQAAQGSDGITIPGSVWKVCGCGTWGLVVSMEALG